MKLQNEVQWITISINWTYRKLLKATHFLFEGFREIRNRDMIQDNGMVWPLWDLSLHDIMCDGMPWPINCWTGQLLDIMPGSAGATIMPPPIKWRIGILLTWNISDSEYHQIKQVSWFNFCMQIIKNQMRFPHDSVWMNSSFCHWP